MKKVAKRVGFVLALPFIGVATLIAFLFVMASQLPHWFNRISDSADALAKRRDGFLVITAIAYALGYVVWALRAWQLNLGLLPALQFQYVLAGIPPLILLAIVVLLIRGAENLGDHAAVTAATLLMVLAGTTAVAWLAVRPFFGISGMSVYVVVTLLIFLTGASFGGIGMLPLAIPWVAMSVFISAFGFYVLYVYPNIPQELGGVRPSCGVFDVKADEVSIETITDLAAHLSNGQKVVRTQPLEIFFVANDFYLVRLATDEEGAPIQRLSSGAVSAVANCS